MHFSVKLNNGGGMDKPLERYVRILEVLSGFPQGLSLAPIADILALPKSTVHRLLKGLAEAGMVQVIDRGVPCYQLGARCLNLLYFGATEDWVRNISQPILEDLALKTGQSCFVAKLTGNYIRSIAIMAPDTRVRGYVLPGSEVVPHAASSAKAILAFQDIDRVKKLLPSPLPKLTPRTKVTLEELESEFKEIRSTKVSYCLGEDVEGYAGIASPILVENQQVIYAIALTGTLEALINRNKELHVRCVLDAAERLSQAINLKMSDLSANSGRETPIGNLQAV